MSAGVIVDTGLVVALLNRGDEFHDWAKSQLAKVQPPLLTCEVVLAEASFLLRRHPTGVSELLRLVSAGMVIAPFRLEAEAQPVADLMRRYANIPMSLADACLVRMAELHDSHSILTLDGDFRVYRMHRRRGQPKYLFAERL